MTGSPLKPATEARRAPARFVILMKARNSGAPARRCSPRRSSFAVISSESPKMRRSLPPGGEVRKNYMFEGERGNVGFRRSVRRQADACDLQLHVRPTTWAAVSDVHLVHERHGRKNDPIVEQRIALVFVARSPIERLIAVQDGARLAQHKLYSDMSGDYTPRLRQRGKDADDDAGLSTCSLGATAASGISGPARWAPDTADPGQDPRGAPDIDAALDHSRHHA